MEAVLPKIAEVQKNIWIKQERKKRQRRLLTELLYDYANHSTLHGLRYMIDGTLTVFEKLFWAVTFFTSLVLCIYHIVNVYEKWDNSPVIVTVGERMIPAVSIPFPAITICPQIKCKASVYKFHQKYANMNTLNETELEELTDIRMLCGARRKKSEFKSVRVTNLTIIDRINKVSPSVQDTIFDCTYNHCKFTNTYTSEGLCFTYNNLAASEVFREGVVSNMKSDIPTVGWSYDNWYKSTVKKSYPARSKLLKTEPHMLITLHSDMADEDPLCNAITSGYKIYLSHPADAPQASVYYYAALNGQISSLAISANIFRSSKSLKKYKIEKRQCYFPEEKYLKYFKLYTLNNCQMECLSNFTRLYCNCYGFYMPRPDNENVTLCGPSHANCMIRAQRNMAEIETMEDREAEKCRCLPMCDNIQYEAEVVKTDYKTSEYLRNLSRLSLDRDFIMTKAMRILTKFNKSTTLFSSITVYFKQPYFVAMQRSELFGMTDFVANIGGLLGVFLGFSFLSFIEIFYFIFIRVGFTIKRDLNEEKNQNND